MSIDAAAEQDVLNRIAAIQAAAEILFDHDDLTAADRRDFFDAIQAETTRLRQLIIG